MFAGTSCETLHGTAYATGYPYPQCRIHIRSFCANLLTFCVMLLGAAAASAQGIGEANQLQIKVNRFHLTAVSSDRAEFLADVEVLPSVMASLEGMRFDAVQLDGQVPALVAPITGTFALTRGVGFALPAARVTLYYADLPSPDRMQQMLDSPSVRMTGEIRGELRLSLLGKLAVRDSHPTAVLELDQQVPMANNAVDTPTQLGVGLLNLVQKTASLSTSVITAMTGAHVTVDNEPTPREQSSMVLVRTSYRLNGTGSDTVRQCVRLGFWVTPGKVLVPYEALEPWAFSVGTASQLSRGTAKLDEASVDITVEPLRASHPAAGAEPPWSRARGDFNVWRKGKPDHTRIVLPNGKAVTLLERNSLGNYAVLLFSKANESQASGSEGTTTSRDSTNGNHVFRWLHVTGDSEIRLKRLDLERPEPARGKLLPSRPLDPATFGSPFIGYSGVTGMVIAEDTVLPLSAVPLD